jgi:hypothetical protein
MNNENAVSYAVSSSRISKEFCTSIYSTNSKGVSSSSKESEEHV